MFLTLVGVSNAQMASVSSNGIRASCAAGCKVHIVDTDVRLSRHQLLNELTEVRVELQQVLTGPHTIHNFDGTTSIVEKTTYKLIDSTDWSTKEINESTTPSSEQLTGIANANPNGDRRYATFRIVGKMRTWTGTDVHGQNEFTNPVAFVTSTPVTLRCGGCDGDPPGGGQAGNQGG